MYKRWWNVLAWKMPTHLSIPIAPGHNLSKSQLFVNDSDTEEMRNILYQEAVSSLMYAVVGT